MTNAALSSISPHTLNTTVLLGDDHISGAQTLQMLLTLEGYDVLVASTGGEAIELFSKHNPAIVLLDISLPDTDGYSVASTLRKRENSRETIIIAVTGWGNDRDVQRAITAGFDYHFCKPLSVDELINVLIKLRRERAATKAPAC